MEEVVPQLTELRARAARQREGIQTQPALTAVMLPLPWADKVAAHPAALVVYKQIPKGTLALHRVVVVVVG